MQDQQSNTPSKEAILEAYNSGRLASDIFVRFGHVDEQTLDSIVTICADLHNVGSINLFSLTDNDVFRNISASHFFSGQYFFCKAIPKINGSIAQMMHFVDALVRKAGADLAANQPNAAFVEWCKGDLSRAREIVDASKHNDDVANKFLSFALTAGDMVAQAIAFVTEHSDERQLAAITALGRMNYEDVSSAKAALSTLCGVLERTPSDGVVANALPSALEIAKKSNQTNSRVLNQIVALACDASGPSTQFCAARALWMHGKLLAQDAVERLLQALGAIDPSHKGTIRELDLGLRELLDTVHADRAIELLRKLLSKPEEALSLSEFPSFNQSLLQGPPARFHRVFISWMLTGVHELCEGMSEVLRRADRGESPINLPLNELQLSSSDQIFLCRKAVGYLFLQPVVASSVLVSVLRVCDITVAETIRKLLLNPLLLNYEGAVKDYLTGLDATDPAHLHVQEVLEANEHYLANLDGTGDIRELHPSEHNRQIERIRFFDRMRRIRKTAEQESIFLSLVRRSVILYGRRSITYIENPGGNRRPVEMELKTHSASMEFPRMEIVDPIGLSYMMLVFRTERPSS